MPLRVKLNGALITDDVYGLEEMEENFFFQPEIYTYLHEITGTLKFTGSSYGTIRSLLDADICDSIIIVLEDNACGQYQPVYEGEVYLTDVKWNLTQCEADVSISDSGIIGLVDDNKSVPVNLYIPTLKNGASWTPIQQITGIGFVNPTVSTATVAGRRGILVFDAIRRVVEVISDGAISVRSDYFDPNEGNPDEAQKNCVLMMGKELRLATLAEQITLTYKDLMQDIGKLYNIAVGFEIDSATGEQFLRVEPRAYFFQSQQAGFVYQGVPLVEQSVEEDIFYAVMEFGSLEPTVLFDYLEQVAFLSHDEQKFHLGGQCNIDNTLDLRTGTLVYDTNVIQRVLPISVGGTADDSWDDEIFIIHIMPMDPSTPSIHPFWGVATPLPYFPTRIYYNNTFSPYSISQRWFGNVPFSIYSYLGGTGSNDAEAMNPLAQPTQWTGTPPAIGAQYQYIDFPNDISDPSNNFNHSPFLNPDPSNTGNISHYLAPAGGLYAVDVSLCWRYGYIQYFQFLVITPTGGIEYFIQPWNVGEGNTPFNAYGIGSSVLDLVYRENLCFTASAVIPMQAGHRLVALIPYGMGMIADAEITVKSTFSGEFQNYDFSTVKYLRTKFDFPIPLSERNQILDSPYAKQRLTYNGGEVQGYLNNMKRNLESGKSELEWLGSF